MNPHGLSLLPTGIGSHMSSMVPCVFSDTLWRLNNTGWGKSRCTVVSMQNTVFSYIIIYCDIFHMSNYKPTFGSPWMKDWIEVLTHRRNLHAEGGRVGSSRLFPGFRGRAGPLWPCGGESRPFTPRPGKPSFSLSDVHLGMWFSLLLNTLCCFLLYKTINVNNL